MTCATLTIVHSIELNISCVSLTARVCVWEGEVGGGEAKMSRQHFKTMSVEKTFPIHTSQTVYREINRIK